MRMDELQHAVRAAVDDPTLTYRQRVQRLAGLAENALDPSPLSDAARVALDKRVVCDLYEGSAPYRPRYVLPDYAKALRQGSEFLELSAPRDMAEATTFLLSAYANVPSITGYPVYLGDLDQLLSPYAPDLTDDELATALRNLWVTIDRTMPDAFTHADIGPDDGRVGRAILATARELRQVVPNLTLRVDPLRTSDHYLREAVRTVFACGGPHFVNHPMLTADLGEDYGVVSCYNSLLVGGGAHTLVRVNLKEVVLHTDGGLEAVLADTLPAYVGHAAELAAARIRHLVEQAGFYEHSWLVDEGLVDPDRFTAMLGVVGLAEAVDLLQEREGRTGRFGHDPQADAMACTVVERLSALVLDHELPYCRGTGGHALLHSQAGLDSDDGVTAGTRVPVGTEPALPQHLRTVTPLHRWFPAGISDVLAFDDTATRNPQAVVDVIRGAFAGGMREFTFNLDSNDFVRVTGYLVRRSEVARVPAQATRHGSSDALGAWSIERSHVDQRAVKRVISGERGARSGR